MTIVYSLELLLSIAVGLAFLGLQALVVGWAANGALAVLGRGPASIYVILGVVVAVDVVGGVWLSVQRRKAAKALEG